MPGIPTQQPQNNFRSSRDMVDIFMNSIAGIETRGQSDPYTAVNSQTGAHGKWQIMPSNWSNWSRETFGRVVSKTPQNQRQVARNKMLEYYDRFGDWDAVAVAWFAGPNRAERYLQGDESVLNLSDGGTTVRNYIRRARKGLRQHSDVGGATLPSHQRRQLATTHPDQRPQRAEAAESSRQPGPVSGLSYADDPRTQPADAALRNWASYLSNRIANGSRMSLDEVESLPDDWEPEDEPNDGTDLMVTPFGLEDRIDMAGDAARRIFGELGNRAIPERVSLPGDLGVPEDAQLDVDVPPAALDHTNLPEDSAGNMAVDIASQYLGTPYKWGGTNPDRGLDCSGLTQLVYKQMGIDLPRVSRDQAQVGQEVGTLDQARPGDLVAFSSRGQDVGHIGIYVGNGKMLHAPRSGRNVSIDPIGNRNPATIRRVV